ncbi:uncharacterized protein LOC129737704 [Uranotaenia lowii]|uniref:uncharacterized protein LOC129737704 n=1 Tax=Uranotaenia lowii TaxID=190385 RepID=UPI002479A6EC|nr:uncharacterized protein LOC129737704 [Uranotaenia lowii]
MANDLRRLSKQKRMLWSLLESIEDFLVGYDDNRDQGALHPRLAKLDEAYDRFSDLHIQMEMLLDEIEADNDSVDDGKQEARRKEHKHAFKEFVNQYFSLKQQLLSKMDPTPVRSSGHQSNVSESVLTCHTKYPELTLPIFSGKLSDWINFRDNFRSLIHDNKLLNDMDKFNYLRTSLKEDALLQINQIQVSAINYSLAWSILEAKYENHKLIAQEHLQALFAAPVMRTESFESLNALLSTFKINLQQLEKLGQHTNSWSTLLAFMLSQKLDSTTHRLWETHHASKNVPSYEAMVAFLENQCSILQSTACRSVNDEIMNSRALISHSTTASEGFCPICINEPHLIEQCSRFYRMRVIDRKDLVRRLKLCLNCLDSGHFVAECSCSSCSKCGQRHHYMLHPYSPNQNSQWNMNTYPQAPRRPQRANSQSRSEHYVQHDQSRTNNAQPSQNNSQSTQQPPPTNTPTVSHHTTLLSTQQNTPTAILSTAIVMLADSSGNTVLARALLDNGSHICLMTEKLSRKLEFERIQESLPITGVGGSTNVSKESVFARILSRTSSFETARMKFFVLPEVTMNLPQTSLDVSTWKLPPSMSLADPTFNESSSVDMVIGVATFYDLLIAEQIRITNAGPVLQNTRLGWIVAGKLPEPLDIPYSTISSEDPIWTTHHGSLFDYSTSGSTEASSTPGMGTPRLFTMFILR